MRGSVVGLDDRATDSHELGRGINEAVLRSVRSERQMLSSHLLPLEG